MSSCHNAWDRRCNSLCIGISKQHVSCQQLRCHHYAADHLHSSTEHQQLVKAKRIYIAPSRETSKALRHGSHSVTCNYTDAYLYLVSVQQMAPPQTDVANI